MKTIISCLILLCSVGSAVGFNDKYIEAMKKNMGALYQSTSIDQYKNCANQFERIGAAEKSAWEPYYYSAFAHIMMATMATASNDKDAYLDKALELVSTGLGRGGDASELTALEGFVHMIRISVDPPSRGQQYSGMAFQTLGKAVSINPKNPRALYLYAQMQFGTADFFGSSTDEACAGLKKAIEGFEAATPASEVAPAWGYQGALELQGRCSN